MEIPDLYKIYSQNRLISTDTRKISPGCLFFALKGEVFDGNTFAEQALKEGAAYAIIDDPLYKSDDRCILVDDVLQTLQQLARYHRSQLKIPFIGITGSNGKTTTKELINSVLSQGFKTYATKGNLNNHIGVPLTLLSINDEIEIVIIEMGANHQREIELLCSIAQPTHGLITNIGKAHLEGFGGIEGVKKGKGELYDWLASNGGWAFINRDNHLLVDMAREKGLQQVVYYGQGSEGMVSGQLVSNDPFLKMQWWLNHSDLDPETYMAETHLTGTYNLENLLSAACIGIFFKLRAEQVNNGLESYEPSNNRSQITKTEHNTLICDYYNANPSSMFVALENFAKTSEDNKTVILGDMFELGDESPHEHEAVLLKALSITADKYIFIGEEFYKLKAAISDELPVQFFKATDEASGFLELHPIKNALILIKGSRGMKMEQLVGLL
jgi:UDP-N-acetylmuramoyl-tripeptide--D-alanyl-D-alanine ligase